MMPNTTIYEFGDVLLMTIVFTNQRQSQQRPAVVISPSSYNQTHPDIIVMPITSQSHAGALAVSDWSSAGLRKASFVKQIIGTYERGEVNRKLGKFGQPMRAALKKEIALILGFTVAPSSSAPPPPS